MTNPTYLTYPSNDLLEKTHFHKNAKIRDVIQKIHYKKRPLFWHLTVTKPYTAIVP